MVGRCSAAGCVTLSILADATTSAEMLEAAGGGDLASMLDDGASSATAAGLRYVAPTDPGFTRRRRGRGFIVPDAQGRPVRVGNDAYAADNGSYGATTLLCRHARVHGDVVELDFRAKGGQRRAIRIRDRRIARVLGQLRARRGGRLFRWRDGTRLRALRSEDVNEYLQRQAGVRCSAKVFRTWAATVVACIVATRLGNTPAVCRESYIHPLLFSRWLTGALDDDLARLRRAVVRRSRRIEAQVIAMLA